MGQSHKIPLHSSIYFLQPFNQVKDVLYIILINIIYVNFINLLDTLLIKYCKKIFIIKASRDTLFNDSEIILKCINIIKYKNNLQSKLINSI